MAVSSWTFEPGHTEVVFRARHMMVTYMTGLIKDVHGRATLDPDDLRGGSFEARMNAGKLWTGEESRDAHLRDADFFDVENHPTITFVSTNIEALSASEYRATGNLSIRGISKPVELAIRSIGQWETPWWEGNEDKGPKTRLGIHAQAHIDRLDWGVSWQGNLDRGGVVVGDDIDIAINAELIQDD